MRTRLILGPLLALSLATSAFAEKNTLSFPTFGLTCGKPDGVASQFPEHPSHIALLQGQGASMVIEVDLHIDASVDDYAASLAQRANIAVIPGNFTVGGERAVKISGPAMESATRTALVVVHDSRGYIFNTLGQNADINDQFLEAVTGKARFTAPDAPSQHTDSFFKTPMTLFRQFSWTIPSAMRPYRQPGNGVNLGMHDFALGLDPFMVNVQHISLPNARRFGDLHPTLGPIFKEKFHLTDTPLWKPHPSVSNLFVTQFVEGTNANGQPTLIRYAAIDLGEGNYVQIVFTIADRRELDLQSYKDLTGTMLDSANVVAGASAAP